MCEREKSFITDLHITLNWTLSVEANGVPTNLGFKIPSNATKQMDTPTTQ